MVVNELVTKFSFIGNLKPQESFNSNLRSSIKFLGGMALAIKGATVAIAGLVTVQSKSLDPLIRLRNETGISTQRLQQLERMAVITGASFEDMASTLTGLNQKIVDASFNGSETFARLGINVRGVSGELKKADQVLIEVMNRFNRMGMGRQQRQFFAGQLGIDGSMIKFLNMSTAEYKKYNEQAARALNLTDKQLDSTDRYNRSLDLLGLNLNGIRNQIAVAVAPQLTELSDRFINLIDNNREWIINGILKTVDFLGRLGAAIARVAPFVLAIGAAFVIAKISALGFAVVMGTIFSPVILLTAAIVAALLILDDLIVAFSGGRSVIRDFFQEWLGVDIVPIMQNIVSAVLVGFDQIREAIAPLADYFAANFSFIGNLLTGNFSGAIDDIKTMFVSLGEFIKRSFTIIFEGLKALATSILPDWAINGATDLFNGVSSAADFLTGGGNQMAMPFPSSPFAGAGGSSVTQSNNINVYSSDPLRAGQITSDRLQSQLSTADAVLSRGGR